MTIPYFQGTKGFWAGAQGEITTTVLVDDEVVAENFFPDTGEDQIMAGVATGMSEYHGEFWARGEPEVGARFAVDEFTLVGEGGLFVQPHAQPSSFGVISPGVVKLEKGDGSGILQLWVRNNQGGIHHIFSLGPTDQPYSFEATFTK